MTLFQRVKGGGNAISRRLPCDKIVMAPRTLSFYKLSTA